MYIAVFHHQGVACSWKSASADCWTLVTRSWPGTRNTGLMWRTGEQAQFSTMWGFYICLHPFGPHCLWQWLPTIDFVLQYVDSLHEQLGDLESNTTRRWVCQSFSLKSAFPCPFLSGQRLLMTLTLTYGPHLVIGGTHEGLIWFFSLNICIKYWSVEGFHKALGFALHFKFGVCLLGQQM